VKAQNRTLAIIAVVVGVLLIVVSIVYFTTPAHSLPAFFPGHVSATDAEANHHHTKHGIAALLVALALFAFAWFQTGPKAGAADAEAATPDASGSGAANAGDAGSADAGGSGAADAGGSGAADAGG
jgi:hypothetical protein